MTITIRFAEPRDAAAIQAVYAPFCEASAVSFEDAPTDKQMSERMARIEKQYPWLVAGINDEVIAYAYACSHRERSAYRWAVDVAVYVDANHHRRGVSRALYTSLFAILRAQGYFKAYAGITMPNPASVGMHEAMGFRPIAVYHEVGYKLGRWRDVGWWELTLQPSVPKPPDPQPISALRASPVVVAALAERQRFLE